MRAHLRNEGIINDKPMALSREDKRRLAHQYHMTMADVERFFKLATKTYHFDTYPEGTKVKLNYDRIMENKDDKAEAFLKFVEDHKNDVMTIKYDERHQDDPTVFCLEEDDNETKWLFDISDLILQEDEIVTTTEEEVATAE